MLLYFLFVVIHYNMLYFILVYYTEPTMAAVDFYSKLYNDLTVHTLKLFKGNT